MGYDLALFVERVDDNFLCAICHQCVKDAVTGCSHGHAFCAGCLATWRQHIAVGMSCAGRVAVDADVGRGRACVGSGSSMFCDAFSTFLASHSKKFASPKRGKF